MLYCIYRTEWQCHPSTISVTLKWQAALAMKLQCLDYPAECSPVFHCFSSCCSIQLLLNIVLFVKNFQKCWFFWKAVLMKLCGQVGSKIAVFASQLIFARSTSAVTPSEKSLININRKFIKNFPVSLRWTLYVTRKGGRKMQNGCFLCKIALHLKKVCYNVSLCEYCQQQSCNAFAGLSIHVKMVGKGVPIKFNFLVKVNHLLAREQMPAMLISSEIPHISCLHHSDYCAVLHL